MSYCYDNALLNIQDFVFYMQVGLGLNVKKTKGMFFNFNVSLLLTVAREVAKQSLINLVTRTLNIFGVLEQRRQRDKHSKSTDMECNEPNGHNLEKQVSECPETQIHQGNC